MVQLRQHTVNVLEILSIIEVAIARIVNRNYGKSQSSSQLQHKTRNST